MKWILMMHEIKLTNLYVKKQQHQFVVSVHENETATASM